jgi:glyoxylase-like metal-dependent hydrolase (beta-lactamase superfamily II)
MCRCFAHAQALAIGVCVLLISPQAARQDLSQAVLEITPVRGGVFVISGGGGNVGAFLGEDGVLLVDASYAQLTDRILGMVRELCEREAANPTIRYLVNTHWHFDHTGGNENMAAAGALIIAQENVLRLLAADQVMTALGNREVPAAPQSARPRLTFSDRINLSWNGDLIHIVHVPNAHTDGDAIVHFRDANVVHTGDIFFNGTYPYIDIDNGGNIGGMIDAVDEILAHSSETMLFIPGHGPLATRQDLADYRNMLTTVRHRIQDLIERGKSRQEVIAAKPTADLDDQWSQPGSWPDPSFWVGLVYDGMMRASGSDTQF